MTHSAATLLMKDIAPGVASAPVSTPTPLVPGAALPSAQPVLNAVERFNLQPVADVLLIERRICKACGSMWETPSDKVHRLFSHYEGAPYKKVLRLRKPDETPLDRTVLHTVILPATHCPCCWRPNTGYGDALATVPPKPQVILGFTLGGDVDPMVKAALQASSKSKSKYKEYLAKPAKARAEEL